MSMEGTRHLDQQNKQNMSNVAFFLLKKHICCTWEHSGTLKKDPLDNSSCLLSFFRCRRTIAMETGCQNIQLCSTILKVAFPQEVIGPLFLFPLVYIVFQGAEALLLIFLFRVYQRFKPSAEGETFCLFLKVKRRQ